MQFDSAIIASNDVIILKLFYLKNSKKMQSTSSKIKTTQLSNTLSRQLAHHQVKSDVKTAQIKQG